MLGRCVWLQSVLTAYVWLMIALPLGHWNVHGGSYLLPSLLHGHSPDLRQVLVIALSALPTVLLSAAYKRRSFILTLGALAIDTMWVGVEVAIYWIPYAFGGGYRSQHIYALYPRIQILPSFEGHYAPDGMTTLTNVLLVLVVCAGVAALLKLRHARQHGITAS